MEKHDSCCSNGSLVSETSGKVITCKAAVAWGTKKPLVIEEVQVDPPKAMEVRIKITHTSLCNTDVMYWATENEMLKVFPRILGHEASGIVESVGEGVSDLKGGDHVITLFTGECGDCIYCKSPKTNLCGKLRIDPTRAVMVNDNKTRLSLHGNLHFQRIQCTRFCQRGQD
ncbi:hypothetical protein SUGI_0015250 [Cryptomeria japonica]|nr:hypothetical protein SUGI_0015250 [Cryptomeria japonica]